MSDEALVDRIANGLDRAWWLPLARGLLMLVLGLLLRIEPLIVFDTIVVVFGLFLIIDGAVAAIHVVSAFAVRDARRALPAVG